MTPLLLAAVAVAGGVGAGLRYLGDLLMRRLVGDRFPWGVLAVNVTGAFALGVASLAVADAAGQAVVGVGLLGGYTTFSSVAVTTVLLAEERRPRAAIGYAVANAAASAAAAFAGATLAIGFA